MTKKLLLLLFLSSALALPQLEWQPSLINDTAFVNSSKAWQANLINTGNETIQNITFTTIALSIITPQEFSLLPNTSQQVSVAIFADTPGQKTFDITPLINGSPTTAILTLAVNVSPENSNQPSSFFTNYSQTMQELYQFCLAFPFMCQPIRDQSQVIINQTTFDAAIQNFSIASDNTRRLINQMNILSEYLIGIYNLTKFSNRETQQNITTQLDTKIQPILDKIEFIYVQTKNNTDEILLQKKLSRQENESNSQTWIIISVLGVVVVVTVFVLKTYWRKIA